MDRIAGAAAALLMATAAAGAQASDRFSMEKTDGGYVRMDRATGQMSLCAEQAGQLVCRVAADERSAVDAETDRLTTRLEELERRVEALERQQPAVRVVPSEEEMDTALTFMQRFFRGFLDIIRDFERETQPAEPQPDRT